jgi:hypothetical protein
VAYEEDGRLVGSDAHVRQRRAQVVLLAGGLILHQTAYMDVDDGRAAAQRLAQERA